MNRRDFLRTIIVVVAAPAIPKRPFRRFDPMQQYGDYLVITDWNAGDVEEARHQMVQQMKSFVPPKYQNKVAFITKFPQEYFQLDTLYCRGSVGWKYDPDSSGDLRSAVHPTCNCGACVAARRKA